MQNIDQQTLTLCRLEEVEGEIVESESVPAKSMEYKHQISAVVRVPSANPLMPAITTAEITAPITPATITTTTRLPKLTINKFCGEVTDWTSFQIGNSQKL